MRLRAHFASLLLTFCSLSACDLRACIEGLLVAAGWSWIRGGDRHQLQPPESSSSGRSRPPQRRRMWPTAICRSFSEPPEQAAATMVAGLDRLYLRAPPRRSRWGRWMDGRARMTRSTGRRSSRRANTTRALRSCWRRHHPPQSCGSNGRPATRLASVLAGDRPVAYQCSNVRFVSRFVVQLVLQRPT